MCQPSPTHRTWLQKPEVFGKGTGRADWKSAQSGQDAILIRAARFQHMLARRVRQLIQDERSSVAAIAAQIGVSDDMLNDALNGYTHLHTTTLDAIANTLGFKLHIEFESTSVTGTS